MTRNQQLLIGLRSQNSSSYMIQAFVVVAVALGIASVLVVWVVQKNREIGILRAVGHDAQAGPAHLPHPGSPSAPAGGCWERASARFSLSSFAGMATNPDGSPTFPVNLSPQLFPRHPGDGAGGGAFLGRGAGAPGGRARPGTGDPAWLSRRPLDPLGGAEHTRGTTGPPNAGRTGPRSVLIEWSPRTSARRSSRMC